MHTHWIRFVAAASLLSSLGCRPKEGERCFCEGECRGGLACAVGGAVLRDGQCIDTAMASSVDAGTCIDGANADGGENDLNPPPFLDLGPWATETTPLPDPTTPDPSATDTAEPTTSSSVTGEPTGSSSGSSGTESSGSGSSSTGGSSSSSSSGSSSTSGTADTTATL